MSQIQQTSFKKVIEFMKAFGQQIFTSPRADLLNGDPKLTSLRIGLIKEENNETIEAMEKNDFIEVVDGLGDTEYVVNGTGAAFGIDLDKEFQNKYINSSLHNNTQTNFQKYVEHMKTEGHNISAKNMDYKKERINLIKEAEKNLEACVQTNNFEEFKNSLSDILYVIYGTAYSFGIDLDEAFHIIHESNMTKLCKTEDEAKETVEWYKREEHRYKEPSYRQTDDLNYWIVYDKTNGKILKSINYTPADLKKFDY